MKLQAVTTRIGFLPVLVLAMLMFAISPPLSESGAGLVALNVLAFGVLFGAIHAAGVTGRWLGISASVAVVGCSMLALDALTGNGIFSGTRAVILMGLWIAAPIAVLARILPARRVTLDTVFGAVAAYFLIGLFCGFLYNIIEEVDPGSFSFPGSPQDDHTGELLYFSLISQTTVGFGDVTPVNAIPRTLVALQAVTGQIYLVVLVARLVAMQIAHSDEPAARH